MFSSGVSGVPDKWWPPVVNYRILGVGGLSIASYGTSGVVASPYSAGTSGVGGLSTFHCGTVGVGGLSIAQSGTHGFGGIPCSALVHLGLVALRSQL